jgi:hypothetical protein
VTATLPVQPTLRLPLAADVTLLSLATACAAVGWHTDRGTEAVETGEWPWVFDLSTGARAIRELRVWRESLTADGGTRNAELSEVLDAVIGTRLPDVRGAALETRWQVSDHTLSRLVKAGELTGRVAGHTLWLSRASLAALLERRRVR